MAKRRRITCLFLDIGGVLLTDGWDHRARRRAAATFKLEWSAMEERHHLTFAAYEEGRLTLEDYLALVVFYQKRPFTLAQFRHFMFAQSRPYPETIDMFLRLKARHGLRIAAVSNEARELNAFRIRKFKLAALVDTFVSSSFMHVRKPDVRIFRLALDLTQAPPGEIVYVENTPMFVEIATRLGIESILHTDLESTRTELAALGLRDPERSSS